MSDDTFVLYVLMRTDLDSLNPGKAMAQSNHAFGALKSAIRSNIMRQKDYIEWQQQTTQDFGTVVVLGGNVGGIQAALDDITRLKLPVVAGWVHDPEYPIKDGEVIHVIPLDTCAYMFGTVAQCAYIRAQFTRHP